MEVNKPIFEYEEYSAWSRMLARTTSLNDLKKELEKCNGKRDLYAKSHLNAIKKTSSMQSNSQRRAHARNNLSANYDKAMALENAIELYNYYPKFCFDNFVKN